ncbi:MAG: mechanosensitive ion channel family protein [Gammaproteobacteria bacterium]|jgi:MscS family membrane protein
MELLNQALDLVGEQRWILEVFFTVLATALANYVARKLLARLAARLSQTRNVYDDALIDAARKPLSILVWVLGISWAAKITAQQADVEVFELIDPAREIAIIFLVAMFAVRFVRFVERNITTTEYSTKPVDETTASAVSKLVRAAVVITAVLTAMQSMGVSISGVLAFGGIGGIAVGFASRELLANFFGAIMIYMDRPFSVGDWIRSPDQEIEGTVEEIGWRVTCIRTFDQRPLYVPNSVFTTIAVENPQRMLNRRIYETIGLRYDDVGKIERVITDVREMLQNHPEIDTDRTLMVNFNGFGASSLDFFIYTFTKTTNWVRFHEIKQEILLEIASIIHAHGADIAYPTRTLLLPSPEPEPGPLAGAEG